MKKWILLGAIVVVAVGTMIGLGASKLVGALSRAGTAADAAVEKFHHQFNAGDPAAIHAAAAPGFRSAVAPEQFAELIQLLHDKLGQFQSTNRTKINLNTNNGDTTLEVGYETTFASGKGTEEFRFDYNSATPLLLSYNIQSPALVAK